MGAPERICARFINGDEVHFDAALTIGGLKVRIANLRGRFAPEVRLLESVSGRLLSDDGDTPSPLMVPPSIDVVLLSHLTYTHELWEAAIRIHAHERDADGIRRAVMAINEAGLVNEDDHEHEHDDGHRRTQGERLLNKIFMDTLNFEAPDKCIINIQNETMSTLLITCLDAGADPRQVNEQGEPCICLAASTWGVDVIDALLHAGMDDIEQRNNDGETCLFYAARASRRGRIKIINRLLRARAGVEQRSNDGQTCIFAASQSGNCHVLTRLLKEHAQGARQVNVVNEVDNNGETCIFWPARNGDHNMVNHLLNLGLTVDHENHNGDTALFWAAHRGHGHTVDRLLDAGATIDHKNNDGETALFWAARRNRVHIVDRLLELGADAHHVNNEGETSGVLPRF